MPGELNNPKRPNFVRLSFHQRLKPPLNPSEMTDACDDCLKSSRGKFIFEIPSRSAVVADVVDRIREVHKIGTPIELLTFDGFYLTPDLPVKVFGEIGAYVKVQPLRPGFQLIRQCPCRLPASDKGSEIEESGENSNTLSTEVIDMDQERNQGCPSDFSNPKLTVTAIFHERVSRNSEVEQNNAEMPKAIDEGLSEPTSFNASTSTDGSWATIETQTSDLPEPEQNQTSLLNGSVAEEPRGDPVELDEGTETENEPENVEIELNSDDEMDSSEADDSSNERQEQKTVMTNSEFSATDRSEPEQNQLGLLNGSVADQPRGDPVELDAGTETERELESAQIELNSEGVMDSAEADDSSKESTEENIVMTSEFSASDQTTGTGSETEAPKDDNNNVGDTYVVEKTPSSAKTHNESNEVSKATSEEDNDGIEDDKTESAGSDKLDESDKLEVPGKPELKRGCLSMSMNSIDAETPSKKRKTNSDGSKDEYRVFVSALLDSESNRKSEARILGDESSSFEGLGDPKTSTPNSILIAPTEAVAGSDIPHGITENSTGTDSEAAAMDAGLEGTDDSAADQNNSPVFNKTVFSSSD